MTAPKTGPLTEAELLDVWKGALDPSYRDPIVTAGEGDGLEAHTQALAIFARTSRGIDKTTQAMFICPWSGQSDDPAAAGAKATVTLTFLRTAYLDRPLVLGAGLVYVEEQTTDWGENGGVEVTTGRRYTLTENLVFHPGDSGPYTVEAEAEKIGYGYNNPLPGTIRLIAQPASNFENNLATVAVTAGVLLGPTLVSSNAVFVSTPNEPDTFVPDHVGQYLYFTDGANLRRTARILQFFGPDLSVIPAIGSRVLVEWDESAEGTVFAGTFLPGERIRVGAALTPTLLGVVLGERVVAGRKRVTFVLSASSTPLVAGAVLTGITSGATMTVGIVLYPNGFTTEAPIASVGGASWRILDWAASWGLVASNEASPDGGVSPWLDELGQERNLYRALGEGDDLYRQRIKTIADVVTPNAIRRALSRALGAIPWCFREVGTEEMPGFFYDGDQSIVGGAQASNLVAAGKLDAYDTDVILFTGVVSSGTFAADERVVLEELPAFLFKADGYFGRIDGGVTFTLIRKTGSAPATLTNHRLRGLTSGAIFTPTARTVPASVATRRFRYNLDYAEFRGFFLAGVPRLGMGEFGFSYDVGAHGAYDAAPFAAFWDGFPYLNAAVYSRVFHAVDEAHAGGVGWGLYREEIGCP